jgi:hypothetical protein
VTPRLGTGISKSFCLRCRASSNDRRKRVVLFTYPYSMAVIHDYFIDAYPEYILKPPSDSDSAFSLTRIWIDEEFLPTFCLPRSGSCKITSCNGRLLKVVCLFLEKTAVIPFGVYQFLRSHPNILQAYRLEKYPKKHLNFVFL